MDHDKELFNIVNEINESIAEGARKDLGLGPDWIYRDVRWFNEEYWQKFLDLLGEGNYVILVTSEQVRGGSRRFGGQFMISEQGLQNIREYNKSKMN